MRKSVEINRVLGRSLLAGITLGAVVGIVRGVLFVSANRYLGSGLPGLALVSLRAILNRHALWLGLLCLAIGITALIAGRIRIRLPIAALWLLAGIAVLLWRLRFAPWTPPVRSAPGLLFFGAAGLTGVALAALAAWRSERVAGWARRISGIFGSLPVAGTALVLLAAVNAAAWWSFDRGPRPALNVLLITIDTLRADHLGAYGYARPTSPNIDRLAREGVLFRRAKAQWPKTSPSFASMLSSTYGHTNGLIRTTAQRMPDRFLLLAELLKAGRYDTSAAVANINLARLFNFDQGFDKYVEIWTEGQDERLRTELVTRHGLDLLEKASHRRPFFLWLHYLDPHARYEPPARFNEMFVGDRHFDPARRAPLNDQIEEDIGGIPARSNLGREDRIAYYVAQYDAEIRYVDEQVGLILKGLEERGLAGKTLVVLTADHGESLGDHNYFFDHGRLPYDDCVRVPLILRGPGTGAPGRAVRSPVELIDMLPTVLDLAGLKPAPDAQGKSLRRLLEGDKVGGTRWAYAFAESGYAENYQRSITTERYKLIWVPDLDDRRIMRGREIELYDLETDPGETRNLVDERPKVAALLENRLRLWIKAGGAAAGAPPAVSLDSTTEEHLRSLGYIR
ncbi:MAG TPA: sulfatase-like hydrolase/transferase [Thermoanaerobaculia bacterium]|nr:sulfatase-like hydrolase/transferase [Thermoanaerobaculia bacterium]